jgi:hypothetical protein
MGFSPQELHSAMLKHQSCACESMLNKNKKPHRKVKPLKNAPTQHKKL